MKRSYLLALSGISAALSTLFVVGAVYLPTANIALYVLSAIAVGLSLTKNSVSGSIMAYIVSSIIVFLVCNVRCLPYIMFFGPYTIISYLTDFRLYYIEKLNKTLKVIVIIICKITWFFIAFFACYYLMKITLADFSLFGWTWTLPVLLVVAAVVFIIYDIVYREVFKVYVRMVEKYIK